VYACRPLSFPLREVVPCASLNELTSGPTIGDEGTPDCLVSDAKLEGVRIVLTSRHRTAANREGKSPYPDPQDPRDCRPDVMRITVSCRICKRGVRLNFIDIQMEQPPVMPISREWNGWWPFDAITPAASAN